MGPQDYFSRSYGEARERFRRCAYAAGGDVAPPFMMANRGAQGEELSTDIVRFGPKDAGAVVVLTSGTHGVEGLAGNIIVEAISGAADELGFPTTRFLKQSSPTIARPCFKYVEGRMTPGS